jgi:hypothetical protein
MGHTDNNKPHSDLFGWDGLPYPWLVMHAGFRQIKLIYIHIYVLFGLKGPQRFICRYPRLARDQSTMQRLLMGVLFSEISSDFTRFPMILQDFQ